jgi:predicted Rossmann-fold nucleotide-binding protein
MPDGVASPAVRAAARDLARTLARAGVKLVCSGSRTGPAREMIDAALAHEGHVIGIVPPTCDPKAAHPALTELRRGGRDGGPADAARQADALVMLPGTLDAAAPAEACGRLLADGAHRIGILDLDGAFVGSETVFEAVAPGRVVIARDVDTLLHALDTARLPVATEAPAHASV